MRELGHRVVDFLVDRLHEDARPLRRASAANMTALACAREAKAGAMRDDLVLYVSDQAHSSIARGARVLGFRPEQVRVLPSDPGMRLTPETLGSAMETDLRAGRVPLFV